MLSQSLYMPQLQAWMAQFSYKQVLVLTLDEFSTKPVAALQRVTGFLGVPSFPRMAKDRQWNWNKRSGSSPPVCSETSLATLHAFFFPHNAHLAGFLARHGQQHAAHFVHAWKHNQRVHL